MNADISRNCHDLFRRTFESKLLCVHDSPVVKIDSSSVIEKALLLKFFFPLLH